MTFSGLHIANFRHKSLKAFFCLIIFLLYQGSMEADIRRANTAGGYSRGPSSDALTNAVKAAEGLCRVPLNCARWRHLIDPKTPEFWREGNHVPDEGYIRLFQEMTPEAARIFLLRGEIKALHMERASALLDQAGRELISAGLMRDRYNVMQSKAPSQLAKKPMPRIDAGSLKGLQYFFIFSPSCSICKQQSRSLVGFPNVHPLQIEEGELFHFPSLNSSDHASRETIARYAPDRAVPVLIIHKSKANKSVVLKGGPLSSEEILLASAELLRSR